METVQNGLHVGLSPSAYFGQERISKTILMAHRKSPAHALHAMTARSEQTASMRTGSLVHTLILEPDTFGSRYTVGPDAARNTKEWKEWAAQQADGLELLKQSEYDDALAMTSWIERKPTLARLVRGAGPTEASVFWSEVVDGVDLAFRARPDKLVEPGILVDLKTTADISDRGIERAISAYGYHLQMALYMQGLAAVGHQVDHAVIVWVETSAPYEARATLLGESWLEAAKAELVTLKARHAACVKANEWPGFADMITDSEAPLWLVREQSNEF